MFPDSHHDSNDRSGSFGALARRAGLSAVPAPVLVGACIVVVFAAFAGLWRVVSHTAAPNTYSFERAGVAEAGTDGVQDETPEDGAPGSQAPEPPSTVWVHVAGAVSTPGLYEVDAGGRVGDAIRAAGGAIGDACVDAVNLARLLDDGERVYVPTREEVDSGTLFAGELSPGPDGGAAGGGASGSGLMDINGASESELQTLPGIGPATATKIVADREANGPYSSPEDLLRVSGIGEKKLAGLIDLVTVR